MNEKSVTCYFCFESFSVYLEVEESFHGAVSEIYDCAVCCNPNKLTYWADAGEISITDVSDGNE
ncbi:MAG: CPXCG motif-containing cysteine-rich protein [SAR324 cluster bacterium]|nr:CPXCG motif-containing cysteine-rich protein [SAR324 cluster bacterium]